jgi:hypothetical protein
MVSDDGFSKHILRGEKSSLLNGSETGCEHVPVLVTCSFDKTQMY